MKPIDSFSGEYRFLSNFYPARVEMGGEEYPNVEQAFQAAKTDDLSERAAIRECDKPGDAKQLGRGATLIPCWEEIKIEIMRHLVTQKFTSHIGLRQALLNTGDAMLIEGNHWRDAFWGVYEGKGENWLGRILMDVRAELIKGGGVSVPLERAK